MSVVETVPPSSQTCTATQPTFSSQTLPASSTPTAQESSQPYRLPSGKHKGKLISEVPTDYVKWLQDKSDAYKSNKQLQEAVDAHLSTLPILSSQGASSQPTASLSQTISTPHAPGESGPYVLSFGKHAGKSLENVPDEYVAWLKTRENQDGGLREAIEEWDKIPRVYRLGFGKYRGYTLDEVPPTYINWLKVFGAPDGHEDLRQALDSHKRHNATAQAGSAKRPKKAFEIPSEYTTDYRRYYYGGTRDGGQMWIGCHDCVRYFGADPKAMTTAGLRPFHKGQRFWLHQVFAYANHFGTTKGETPTKALNKFKAKNYNKPYS